MKSPNRAGTDGALGGFLWIGTLVVVVPCLAVVVGSRRGRSLRTMTGPFLLSYALFLTTTSLYNMSPDNPLGRHRKPDFDFHRSLEAGGSSAKETDKRMSHDTNTLVIAAVPRGPHHILSLWSQFECVTHDMDHVIIVAPGWARETLIEPVIEKARRAMPNLRLDPVYLLENKRYDIGLWCAAIDAHRSKLLSANSVTLINDSVHLIRANSTNRTIDTLEYLQTHHDTPVDVVSLTYHDYLNGSPVWLESVLRTFTTEGIRKFHQHICQSKFQCGWQMGDHNYKRCVVSKYEVEFIDRLQSTHDRSIGLYPALPNPKDKDYRQKLIVRAWSAGNQDWWQELVARHDFPIQKVAMAGEWIPKHCTTRLDMDWVRNLNYTMPPKRCRRQCPSGGARTVRENR